MGIRIRNGGPLTTVQDQGRYGYEDTGIGVSGVMDARSAALANILVGNEESETVLETTLMGLCMEFTECTVIAVTGGNLGAQLNGKQFPLYTAVAVQPGQILNFTRPVTGCRAYIAFAGGLDVPKVMGSCSTDLKAGIGGVEGRKLKTGDELTFRNSQSVLSYMEKRNLPAEDFSARDHELRVISGPQDDHFTENGLRTFFESVYTVSSECDRMGCRLQGPKIEHRDGGDIITDGVCFGSIQVPSHGNPIIMMADHQTTGGYAKIAHVITVDLPILAQCMPGHTVHFTQIGVEEAQNLYCTWRQEMNACAARWNVSTRSQLRVTVNGTVYLVDVERLNG